MKTLEALFLKKEFPQTPSERLSIAFGPPIWQLGGFQMDTELSLRRAEGNGSFLGEFENPFLKKRVLKVFALYVCTFLLL